jgi:hypothetical protein
LGHENKETVATRSWFNEQNLPFLMVAAVARAVTTVGQVVIGEGKRRIQTFRFDMLHMSSIFMEMAFAVYTKTFLFVI